MRRALAISLLLLFGWNLAAPLLLADPDATLPPCCRRHGKHHCSMMDRALGYGPAVTAVSERCPCRNAATTASRTSSWQPLLPTPHFAGLCRQPLVVEQTRALARISVQRSHRKRGPPTSPAA